MAFTDQFGHPKGILGRLMLILMEREHLPMARWAFEQFDVPKSGQIADLGCGGGYNVRRLLQKSASAFVYGLDLSEESVKKAQKVNRAALGKRCKILQGRVEALPFEDYSLSLVTAFETVFFWKEIERGFQEIHRVLTPGGRCVIVNNYGDPKIDWEKKVPCMKRQTAEQIQKALQAVGFLDVIVQKKGQLFCVQGKASQR